MDASLPKGKKTGGAEMIQPLIKEEKFTKMVDPLMDTASKCPRCDRPRSSLTP